VLIVVASSQTDTIEAVRGVPGRPDQTTCVHPVPKLDAGMYWISCV